MKKIICALLLGLIIGLGVQAGNAPTTIKSEMEVLVPNQKPMTHIFYLEGTNTRTEMYEGTGANKTLMTIMIVKGDYMYMLYPANKTAMKTDLKAVPMRKKEEAPKCEKWEECLKQSQNEVITSRGKEQWEGKEYTVYRATNNQTKAYIDYYVDSNGMLKRWISYDVHGKLQADNRLIKFEKGKALPQGIFEIPAGYQVMDMPSTQGKPL